jgi:cytochrome c553
MPSSKRSMFSVFNVLASTLLMLGLVAQANAAGDAARGKLLSYTCLGCHGITNYKNVYPTYSVPKLLGQHPEYIAAALKAYKSKERAHATMHVQALSLNDQDMEDIAVYFAGEPLKPGAVPLGTAPSKVTELCVACHGKDGIGITGEYPTLAGQHADYLLRSLVEYQRGDRKNAVMAGFVTTLKTEDLEIIADYYARQRPELLTARRRTWWFSAE